MTTGETLACSLSGSEFAERITEWREVVSHATDRHVEKGRIVSTYPPDRQLLQRLRKLIAAEADCCSFMQFNVTEGPDHVEVELRVPADMIDALAMMLGLVSQSPGPLPRP